MTFSKDIIKIIREELYLDKYHFCNVCFVTPIDHRIASCAECREDDQGNLIICNFHSKRYCEDCWRNLPEDWSKISSVLLKCTEYDIIKFKRFYDLFQVDTLESRSKIISYFLKAHITWDCRNICKRDEYCEYVIFLQDKFTSDLVPFWIDCASETLRSLLFIERFDDIKRLIKTSEHFRNTFNQNKGFLFAEMCYTHLTDFIPSPKYKKAIDFLLDCNVDIYHCLQNICGLQYENRPRRIEFVKELIKRGLDTNNLDICVKCSHLQKEKECLTHLYLKNTRLGNFIRSLKDTDV